MRSEEVYKHLCNTFSDDEFLVGIIKYYYEELGDKFTNKEVFNECFQGFLVNYRNEGIVPLNTQQRWKLNNFFIEWEKLLNQS